MTDSVNPPAAFRARKDARISMRVRAERKQLIELAAGLEGVTLSRFITDAAMAESKRILGPAATFSPQRIHDEPR